MSGIKLIQDNTTINAAGIQNPSMQVGAIIGSVATLSFTSTSATYSWTASGPDGSSNTLSNPTTASPTITFDKQGIWIISLTDASSNVYTLPLSVAKVTVTEFTGPVYPAYCTPAQVATPALAQSIFQDSSNSGALSTKDLNAVVRVLRGKLSGSTTWDPGSVGSLSSTTTTVTVTGASVGDPVSVGFSQDLQGMILTGYVSASNTVTVVLFNPTGGGIDLASGTLRVDTY